MIELFIATTLHLGLGKGWNNVHPGIRYIDGPWSIGAYYNSEFAVSPYATYTLTSGEWFIEGGLVGGYSTTPVLPMIRAGIDRGNVRYFIAPGAAQFGDETKFGIVIGVETKF